MWEKERGLKGGVGENRRDQTVGAGNQEANAESEKEEEVAVTSSLLLLLEFLL